MKLVIGSKGLLIKTNRKINRRTVILIILALVVLIAAVVGALKYNNKQKALSEKTSIETKTLAYATDLEDSKESMTSPDAVAQYLTNWAKAKGVTCKADTAGNVIMNSPAGKDYKKAKPTLLVCSYNVDHFEGCIAPMALSLYLAKNNDDTGKLRIIFTNNTENSFKGIQALDKDYIKGDWNIICVNGNGNNFWSTKTGGSSSYEFTKKYSTSKPKGNKAIKIYIKGLPGGVPTLVSSYPNPIKELGNLLASFKTNAYIYELADFQGGQSGTTLPSEASTTIVINENDFQKFSNKLDSYVEKYKEKRTEKYPEVEIGYEEVKLPKRVMKRSDADEFVSVLYTLLDGVYYKDNDDKTVSATNIGSVSENDGHYSVLASGNSLEASALSEIDTAYKTICGLSNIKYNKQGEQESWKISDDSTLPSQIMDAFRMYSGKNLEYTESAAPSVASYIVKYNKKADIICVNLNSDRLERYTGTILTFLRNQEHK